MSYEYAGFWRRLAAFILDAILWMLIVAPLLVAIYGPDYWMIGYQGIGFWDLVLYVIAPIVVVITLWAYHSATPGKMIMQIMIIDLKTGEKPTKKQWIIRYFSCYLSAFALGLGFLWVAFDKRKQGWHDKLAKTLVVKEHTRL